jgi:hypothetical protein
MIRLAVSGATEGRRRTTRHLILMIRSMYGSGKIHGKSRLVFEVCAQRSAATRKSRHNVNFL